MKRTAVHRKTCKRYDIEGHAHYLTFSCFGRQPLLRGQLSPRWFLDAVDAARQKHGFDLWAFVIMPEHAHVLLLPGSAKISSILQSMKQPVTQKAVRWARRSRPVSLARMEQRHRDGSRSYHFWLPGGGYDRNIWTPRELHKKIRYIHANPVRRGLAASPGDWPWSSWRAWELGVDEPIRIDRESLPPLEIT